jgi:hypothetical protein
MNPFIRMPIVFGLLVILSCVPAAAAEDKGRITGNVTSVSGSPVRDAIIQIFRDTQDEVFSVIRSDNHGTFRSLRLLPGVYRLQVSHDNYQPVTTRRFAVDQTRTISFNIALQEFVSYLSREDDPRNWDIEDVMRSTSDRRMIFRNVPDIPMHDAAFTDTQFTRSGSMNIASTASLGNESYPPLQQAGNGLSSSFALAEPLSDNSRMILSGQLDVNTGSFWRIRNTYNYRPDDSRDFKASIGLGRMTGPFPIHEYPASPLMSSDPEIEMYLFSMEFTNRLLDILAVQYGMDYSRYRYGSDKSFFHPSMRIIVSPSNGWNINTSVSSNRLSDTDTVILPDGEIFNLSDPTLITMVDDRVRMTQVRHSEVALERLLHPGTTVELALYQDHMRGPGIPLMITEITPEEQTSHVIEMNGDRSTQQGMRISVNHRISDFLSSSVAYVYGEAGSISVGDEPISRAGLDFDPARYLNQQYGHSITGRITTVIPVTHTTFLASMRWNSGNPLSSLDWFSDRMDIGTRSVNLVIRQGVPFPEFYGTSGRWEFLVDLRNILNQGKEILPTTDGELVLNRNPRSIRVGINFSFR